MTYADPIFGREQRRKQAARRRREKPALMRAQRTASAKRRRAIDPLRGMTKEEFLAAARKYTAARRARELKAFVENVVPTAVYQMHGGMCGICKEFIVGDFHVDHIKPLSKGGLHCYANMQPAHPACNLSKGDSWDNLTGC